MRRVANGTQASARPASPAAVGTPGYFDDRDPANGVLGTIVDDAWLNDVQDALLAFGEPVVIDATRSVTVPAWATRAVVELWGPTGGAGGAAGPNSAGAGAGGGGYVQAYITGLVPGASILATVGAPGDGGAPGSNGAPGTSTTFGPYASASPGGPGNGATGSIATVAGLGGSGTLGPGVTGYVRNGEQGTTGLLAGSAMIGAFGGGAHGCGLRAYVTSSTTTAVAGGAGVAPGQGGSGGVSGGNGGTGGPARIIVRWLP